MTAGIQQGPFDSSYGVQFIGDNATICADRLKYRLYPEWDEEKKTPKAKAVSYDKGVNPIASM